MAGVRPRPRPIRTRPPEPRHWSGTFGAMDAVEVVRAYWEAAADRRWDDFGALLADDVVYEAPQSRERVRGRGAYLRFNEEGFPGPWRLEVVKIVGGDTRA